jgi:hypothetical protein
MSLRVLLQCCLKVLNFGLCKQTCNSEGRAAWPTLRTLPWLRTEPWHDIALGRLRAQAQSSIKMVDFCSTNQMQQRRSFCCQHAKACST